MVATAIHGGIMNYNPVTNATAHRVITVAVLVVTAVMAFVTQNKDVLNLSPEATVLIGNGVNALITVLRFLGDSGN